MKLLLLFISLFSLYSYAQPPKPITCRYQFSGLKGIKQKLLGDIRLNLARAHDASINDLSYFSNYLEKIGEASLSLPSEELIPFVIRSVDLYEFQNRTTTSDFVSKLLKWPKDIQKPVLFEVIKHSFETSSTRIQLLLEHFFYSSGYDEALEKNLSEVLANQPAVENFSQQIQEQYKKMKETFNARPLIEIHSRVGIGARASILFYRGPKIEGTYYNEESQTGAIVDQNGEWHSVLRHKLNPEVHKNLGGIRYKEGYIANSGSYGLSLQNYSLHFKLVEKRNRTL
ncbi:MAG: hypothetical protein CL678_04735 [Bdellovibrionaceae bacterium]|nr:hypothetical protein [Pseudobdellovibrionaceae bacterium]|tara:strand:- start:2129 stop:2983 length:855 start_codon:yes stop_codon:yes gene_type:complete